MPRTHLASVTSWITLAALRHGDQLADHVAERLGVTRRSAQAVMRRLEAAQWLQREGSTRRPRFRPGPLRQVVQRYALAGLQEDLPWSRDFAPCLTLPAALARIAEHAFTELLNNAIDHSGGSAVTVSMRQTATHLQLLVSDDGCGLFDRVQQHFDIDNPQLAMLELGKGKLTTQPDRHRGHGLFFTARLADIFDLHANRHAFQFRGIEQRRWHAAKPLERQGTSIFFAVALDTPRTVDAVLREHSASGAGYAFERTSVPLKLITGGHTMLASRAQARRVAARLESFRRAELDFSDVGEVGHAFADELFRVIPRRPTAPELVPVAMTPQVAAMVQAARAAA